MWRLFTPKWLLGHAVVAVVFCAFLRLGWWQWQHAIAGNTLSYGYAAQWPLFAFFGLFFWVRIVLDRRQQRPEPPTHRQETAGAPIGDSVESEWTFGEEHVPMTLARADQPSPVAPPFDHDGELAAYNDMLAWLNANPRRRLADYQPLGSARDTLHRPR